MTAAIARLRRVPTIEFELEEGQRLRRTVAKGGRSKVQADGGRPHQPWSEDICNVQMRAKVAVTLVEEVFRNVRALEGLHETRFEIGLDELVFQIHELKRTAELLQTN